MPVPIADTPASAELAESAAAWRPPAAPRAVPAQAVHTAAALPAWQSALPARQPENGGPSGPEPTRYGDWERRGRCIDF
jgi:hypothetical protein